MTFELAEDEDGSLALREARKCALNEAPAVTTQRQILRRGAGPRPQIHERSIGAPYVLER
jgi:hypothetical protein